MCQPGLPGAECGGPRRLARPGRLPEHEVERIVLRGLDGHALSGAQVVEVSPRELAVAGEVANGEVDIPVGAAVGEPLALEDVDEFEHRADVAGRARLAVGREEVQPRAVLGERGRRALGQGLDGLAAQARPLHDLVVDVGDVAHVGDGEPARAKPPHDEVEHGERARIADVDIVVDRGAADIDARAAGNQRDEGFLPAREGVVDRERGHGWRWAVGARTSCAGNPVAGRGSARGFGAREGNDIPSTLPNRCWSPPGERDRSRRPTIPGARL